MRDAFKAVHTALLNSERVAQLSREVTRQSQAMGSEFDRIDRDVQELRDRVSRIEGAFAVLDRLRISRDEC